jgi:hypothetical protein
MKVKLRKNNKNPLNNSELSFRWSEATEKSFQILRLLPLVEVTKYIFQMIQQNNKIKPF